MRPATSTPARCGSRPSATAAPRATPAGTMPRLPRLPRSTVAVEEGQPVRAASDLEHPAQIDRGARSRRCRRPRHRIAAIFNPPPTMRRDHARGWWRRAPSASRSRPSAAARRRRPRRTRRASPSTAPRPRRTPSGASHALERHRPPDDVAHRRHLVNRLFRIDAPDDAADVRHAATPRTSASARRSSSSRSAGWSTSK